MRTLSTFCLGMVFGAALLYAALSFHVVRADDGIHVISKTQLRLPESYVDIRSFGLDDWMQRPQLAQALREAGKEDLFTNSAVTTVGREVGNVLDGWQQ